MMTKVIDVNVNITIFDMAGKEVATLYSDKENAACEVVDWLIS